MLWFRAPANPQWNTGLSRAAGSIALAGCAKFDPSGSWPVLKSCLSRLENFVSEALTKDTPGLIAFQSRLDRFKQCLLVQRLGQEFNGPGFHGLN